MGRGTKARGAVESQLRIVGALARDRAIALRVDLRFVGEDRIDAERRGLLAEGSFWESVFAAQRAAQLMEQRILAAVGKIGDADARWIATASGAAAGDGEEPTAMALSLIHI